MGEEKFWRSSSPSERTHREREKGKKSTPKNNSQRSKGKEGTSGTVIDIGVSLSSRFTLPDGGSRISRDGLSTLMLPYSSTASSGWIYGWHRRPGNGRFHTVPLRMLTPWLTQMAFLPATLHLRWIFLELPDETDENNCEGCGPHPVKLY
ncbi:hypothetical protein NL676_003698 [Syzygium grande]|nr:hypothetical protein NL676_003698 [Syzygium grande]